MRLARGKALAVLSGAAVLALAACGGGSGTSDSGASSTPQQGGTLYILSANEQFDHLDPQRMYTGRDMNIFSAFTTRSLTTYNVAEGDEGTTIQADLATDTGTASNDSKTWEFTLRDGVTFETGDAITCADVAYGVSRTFATGVITDGPTYAISMLDIKTNADGSSYYPGPYEASDEQQAAFDKAVSCSEDGKTITFNLNKSVPDFNYTTTMPAFSPVPEASDNGEQYDAKPVATGPYKISSYEKGKSLILVRNESWDQASDPFRQAYPDTVEIDFNITQSTIDQRLQQSAGDDAYAVSYDDIDPSDVSLIFSDTSLSDRIVDDYDAYVRYAAINVTKVTNLKVRQAMLAAINREALIKIAGGDYAGDIADGVIKPNIGQDYAETGLWSSLLGAEIPDTGDVEYAKTLLAESGETDLDITIDYSQAEGDTTADKTAAQFKTDLEAAGFTVTLNPIEAGGYYSQVMDPEKANDIIFAGWGPDWPNASTVIPELFTPTGGFNLSLYDDADYTAEVEKAKTESDRAAQAKLWQDLNKKAMEQALVIPTRFSKAQQIIGSKVGIDGSEKPYNFNAYGGVPFANLYLKS